MFLRAIALYHGHPSAAIDAMPMRDLELLAAYVMGRGGFGR